MIFATKKLVSLFGEREAMNFQKENNLICNRQTGELLPVIKRGKEVRLYEMGCGWGSRISIWHWPEREGDRCTVHGHKNPRPVKGDLLLIPMQSGKTLLAQFIAMELCNDPPDQFFADVKEVGYVEDMDEATRGMLANASEGPITLQ